MTTERMADAVDEDHDGIPRWSLRAFTGAGHTKGRSRPVQVVWFVVQYLFFVRWWFPTRLRPAVLRAFGARVGERVLIRNGVKVRWPWRLTVGDDVWIGENAWLLDADPIRIGNDVCISQEAFLTSGGHRWDHPAFELVRAPVVLDDSSWVAVRATVLPGVTVGTGAVVAAGAVASRDLPPGTILLQGGRTRRARVRRPDGSGREPPARDGGS